MSNFVRILFLLLCLFPMRLLAKQSEQIEKIESLLSLGEALEKINPKESKAYNLEALGKAKEIENDSLSVKALLRLANNELDFSNINHSYQYLEQAESLTDSNNYKMRGKIYNNLGRVYMRMDLQEKSSYYFLKGLRYRILTKDEKEIASSYANLSIIKMNLKQFDEARNYLLKADSLYRAIDDLTGLSVVVNNLGSIEYDLKKYSKALAFFKQSLEYDIENDDVAGQAVSLLNIGDTYLKMKNYSEAEAFFDRCVTIVTKIDNKATLTALYNNYGDLKIASNQPDYARKYYKKAASIAKKYNIKRKLLYSYDAIYKIYEKEKNTEQAYKYLKLWATLKDSIASEDLIKQVKNLEMKSEIERRDNEITALNRIKNELQSELQNNKILLSVLGISLAAVVLMIAQGVLLYRKKHTIVVALKDSQKEIEEQKNELAEMNKDKDLFISIFSHDIKNLFTTLLNSTEILHNFYKNMNEEKKEKLIKNSYDSSIKIYSLFESLLEWSVYQAKKIQVHKKKIDVDKFILDTIHLYTNQAAMKQVILEYAKENEYYIYSDQNLLHTILRNLISNAIKFSHPGSIIISAEMDDKHAIFSVQDNGNGISDEKIKAILQTETVVSTDGTRKERGTGIGLGICKKYATLLNGFLTIENNEGTGSTFSVHIPLENEL